MLKDAWFNFVWNISRANVTHFITRVYKIKRCIDMNTRKTKLGKKH